MCLSIEHVRLCLCVPFNAGFGQGAEQEIRSSSPGVPHRI